MTEASTQSAGNGSSNGGAHGDDPLAKRVAEGPRGGARTWYDVLEVSPDVSAPDLKKAYDRALALVEGRSIGGYLMLDPLAAESARADVEAAYYVLGDPERRRTYDNKLRESGEEPVSHHAHAPPTSTPPTSTSTDEESRQARELLAIEQAQEKQSSSPSSPPASSSQPPKFKFTAPAEPSEEALPSPGRPSTPPPLPSKPPIAFAAPVASPDPFQPIPTRRIFVSEPIIEDDSKTMQATATIPPEMSMPSPASPGPASSSTFQAPPKTSPGAAAASAAAASTSTPAAAAPGLVLPESGEVPGALIRELREARGLTLDDLAAATKIRKPYLKAIEEEDVPNLPARVYLRGFLTQIARLLRVDRQRLADGYLLTAERLSKGT